MAPLFYFIFFGVSAFFRVCPPLGTALPGTRWIMARLVGSLRSTSVLINCRVVISHPVHERGRQTPPEVRLDLAGGVARICLDRPPVNAFTVGMFRQLHTHLKRAGESLMPVLLTGANGRFSAGFDVKHPGLNDASTANEAGDCVAAIKIIRRPWSRRLREPPWGWGCSSPCRRTSW